MSEGSTSGGFGCLDCGFIFKDPMVGFTFEMVSRVVFYVMSGPPHLPYMLVSLASLQQHYLGPIIIFAWPESYGFVKRILEDPLFAGVEVREWDPDYRGKNCQFICKQKVMNSVLNEYQQAIYLDADTMLTASPQPIFDQLNTYEFVPTQFNDWYTNEGQPKKRIGWLEDIVGIPQDLVDRAREERQPSPNGGIFAARRGTEIVDQWIEWTFAAKSLFIADEIVLHLMKFKFPEQVGFMPIGWNVSPKFFEKGIPELPHPDYVKVWHFHGDSNCRPDKSQYGYDLWFPIWQTCLDCNIGFVQEWEDRVRNKWLNRLKEEEDES